jgi:hypothetical protein
VAESGENVRDGLGARMNRFSVAKAAIVVLGRGALAGQFLPLDSGGWIVDNR